VASASESERIQLIRAARHAWQIQFIPLRYVPSSATPNDKLTNGTSARSRITREQNKSYGCSFPQMQFCRWSSVSSTAWRGDLIDKIGLLLLVRVSSFRISIYEEQIYFLNVNLKRDKVLFFRTITVKSSSYF